MMTHLTPSIIDGNIEESIGSMLKNVLYVLPLLKYSSTDVTVEPYHMLSELFKVPFSDISAYLAGFFVRNK